MTSRARLNRHCECPHDSEVATYRLANYDSETERPFVNHLAGECECQNDLRLFRCSDGETRLLCSCCCLFGDVPIEEAPASLRKATRTARRA